MEKNDSALPPSFRDPSGFLFVRNGQLLRQVNPSYQPHYEQLMSSGLYDKLTAEGLLIPHEEVPTELGYPGAYRVLRPQPVPFVSYPYEWSFTQLQEAALATLRIQRLAMDKGMSLKDASAYNIQFVKGRPTLIDTLSFEIYPESRPWTAYRQFCQHFLAPLALMSYGEPRANMLLRLFMDGVPLEMAATFLPWRTRLKLGLLLHLHYHARLQQSCVRNTDSARSARGARSFSRTALLGLLDQLEGTIRGLPWKYQHSTWSHYYSETHNYSPEAMAAKKRLVEEYLAIAAPRLAWDLGANVGTFSRLAAARGAFVVAFDVDPICVDLAYRDVRREKIANILPLLMDLTNPSPAQGWAHQERMSLVERGPADVVMALALVHHLAIGNNVPLRRIAEFLASLGRWLIIEFVPKSDSQVQKMLRLREDVFADYTLEAFEREICRFFALIRRDALAASERTLYLLEKK